MIEVVRLKAIRKCSVVGCKNCATHKFSAKIKTTAGENLTSLHLCKECLSEIYTKIGELTVPKAVKSPFLTNFD